MHDCYGISERKGIDSVLASRRAGRDWLFKSYFPSLTSPEEVGLYGIIGANDDRG